MKNLMKKDFRIVERKKLFFIIPICLLLVGIIAGVIFGFATDSPLNLSTDFTGGYTLTVKTGKYVSSETYSDYEKEINNLISDYSYTYYGTDYGVRLSRIGWVNAKEASDNAIRIEYKADKSLSVLSRDKVMDELNKDFAKAVSDIVRYQHPVSVSVAKATSKGDLITLTYNTPITSEITSGNLKATLAENGINATNFEFIYDDPENPIDNMVQFNFTSSQTLTDELLKSAGAIDRYFSIDVLPVEMASGTLSLGLVSSMIYAFIVILLVVLLYVFIRFEIAGAVSIISSLFLDMVMVLVLMTVFHVQITTAFIAALVAVMIYSLINHIFLFDRIREIRKTVDTSNENVTASDVANRAIKHTFIRNMFVTLSAITVVGIAVIVAAIGGTHGIAMFGLPIVFGLISGFFSSICFAPSLWVFFKQDRLGKVKQFRIGGQNKKAAAKETIKAAPAEVMDETIN